jgi:hypothetical protein
MGYAPPPPVRLPTKLDILRWCYVHDGMDEDVFEAHMAALLAARAENDPAPPGWRP